MSPRDVTARPPETAAPSSATARVREYLADCVRIDMRTLALFRIMAGLLIIAEVALRLRNFSFFYVESGVIPQDIAVERTADYAVSVYFLTTDSTLIAVLFGLQLVFALLLLVGYRTRTMTVVCFLFVVSIDHHAPIITSYADTLFRMLLFWAIFLPLGERWSVDAVLSSESPRSHFLGIASVAILSQMVYMYLRNGIHKTENELWTGEVWVGDVLRGDARPTDISIGADATPLILGRDDITFLLGEYTHHLTPVLQVGTTLWFYMMLSAWLLILLRGRWRYPVILLFVGGHGLFAVTVRIGLFPYVAMAGLALFLPTQFWRDGDRLLQAVGVQTNRLRMGLHSTVDGLRPTLDRLPAGHLTPPALREEVYAVVLVVIAVTVAVVVAIGGLQFAGLVEADNHDREVDRVASTLSVDQPDWSIFAPNPATTDRWYAFPAKTESGELVDAYNDREWTWDRPGDQLQVQYGTYRERFYMNTIRSDGIDDGPTPPILAEYYCENYETEDGESLTHVNMWTVWERVTLDTLDDPGEREGNEYVLYRHGCGDNDPERLVTSP